ncbi:MAG: hypothetical protein AAF599_08865 [Bacteroidota bacterium]
MTNQTTPQVFHIVTDIDPYAITLALHCAKEEFNASDYFKHFRGATPQNMKTFFNDMVDQIEKQMDSDHIYIVRKRIGKKMITCFELEEQANAYIEKKEDLEVLPLKKAKAA